MADYASYTVTADNTVDYGTPWEWSARVSAYTVVAGGTDSYANVTVVQRVWDSGSGGRWCYYAKTAVDPAPLSTETAPNWTGSTSLHQVVGVVKV